MSGENHPLFGVPLTEETKKKLSVANSGEKHPMYGITGEKHPNYGNTGALNPLSKAIIAIKPDGTELHFESNTEAARELGINQGCLSRYARSGHILTQGPRKGWRFIYENP
jgi:hypothetical protein